MNYKATLEYMFSRLPMFQREGRPAFKPNLNNSWALMKILNQPHQKFSSIHVAGTNGKGSTSHMITSVLIESGLKVGLYTSPHLVDFRERIRVNGNKVSENFIVEFIEKHRKDIEKIGLSFFELTVGMAFDYFAQQEVDVAVIEVGMGGRLDSTNVIKPLLSIITNIGLDHTFFLGETLKEIAEEKAGIIKEKTPVLVGRKQNETTEVFKRKADLNHSKLLFSEDIVTINDSKISNGRLELYNIHIKSLHIHIPKIITPLSGSYQIENVITVIAAMTVLKQHFNINEQHLVSGLENVLKNTHLRGRWEKLSENPLIICDTGHNVDGLKFITSQLKSLHKEKIHFVLGVVNDKDLHHILELLPKDAIYYFCKADIPRGLNAEILAEKAKVFELNGKVYDSVAEAYLMARKNVRNNEMVFIGGSTFTVAEVLGL